jgi:hypothetical protein
MAANDTKIKELLAQIEAKKAQIGDKPRATWKTNGIIGEEKSNINLMKMEACVSMTSKLIQERDYRAAAVSWLGVPAMADTSIQDALEDLKLRASILKYDEEKKKLTALEAKLKDLRSNDAKTEDAIAELASLI